VQQVPQQVSAATYYRVSTDDQCEEMQRADIHAYCTQRNFTIYREYCDHGISGTRERRPALDELMADARKRKFDVVLVWDFSRFARSTKHLINALEEFRHLGIDFVSYRETIDTASPLGKMVFVIVAAVAELERNIISERIKGGLRRAKALGKHVGRPALRNGEQVDAIRRMRKEGKSYQAIAQALGVSKSAVHKWGHDTALTTGAPCDVMGAV
jgi:DNA invertase Pin-like site-specific DNA recombinase